MLSYAIVKTDLGNWAPDIKTRNGKVMQDSRAHAELAGPNAGLPATSQRTSGRKLIARNGMMFTPVVISPKFARVPTRDPSTSSNYSA